MNATELPVYKHKDLILQALESHQVIVVESPTGSGKTTQLPVILHDAGYAKNGIIGVTQPRRIAAVSVCEYIARQKGLSIPELVGYKMRFEDRTDHRTKIKIMTDGILLQEMKLDPWLSKYDVLIVDEAHERSLNIDFILGLLKRVLEERKEFKVVVSSATINTQVFSEYFGECPVVKIDAITWPVTLVYDPPAIDPADNSRTAMEATLLKIEEIVSRVSDERRDGDILIFLPGEKAIKDCMTRLYASPAGKRLYCVPLYGRLGKEEQERVFDKAPRGKIKVVVSTNIAETSVTIDGITTVIDSGRAKLNFYNPKTFTSSLIEVPVSKASCNQRKGRAGRTREGWCYRLYSRKDFEARELFTTEEIFRTDLSEVVLRMSELGVTAFEDFDFISPPNRLGLLGGIETLTLLDALEADRNLSKIGRMMARFPLPPRQSRIIVEAILHYPDVTEETIIAAAFLSTQGPYILPPGEEMEARRAHHAFRDPSGDFVSNLRLYRLFTGAKDKKRFCEQSYLDERTLHEIVNVKEQLEQIVSDMGVPILSGGDTEDYLCCVARGLIQFVCVREGSDMYRSLTAGSILIHPGSVMFRETPQYIVAGEIVRTTRMYAMSVSPLRKSSLARISPTLYEGLIGAAGVPGERRERGASGMKSPQPVRDFTNKIKIGSEIFDLEKRKGHKIAVLPWEKLSRVIASAGDEGTNLYKDLRGEIRVDGRYSLFQGEKLALILDQAGKLAIDGASKRNWQRKKTWSTLEDLPELIRELPNILQPAIWKKDKHELGFICLFTDGAGSYWFKCSRGFHTALNESLASIEALIDELPEDVGPEERQTINQTWRRLSDSLKQ